MDYKVLYRKYRPESFDTLIGQESIVRILRQSIIDNKLSHAYIFSGPRGTGKTSTARILAKTINCLESKDGLPCNKCEKCLNFSTNPDIIEIDAASNNGVDEIRELINNVKLMPSSSKYKVYIIDEVHMLSQSAFNALLLTLEEPPKHVMFILATTNIESVPITILSRCQKFEFSKISESQLLDQLESICQKENIAYTLDGLKEIALLADGGMRDALSILDQLSKENKEININLVTSEIGTVSTNTLNKIFDNLNANNVNNLVEDMNYLKKANVNYKVVIKKLIDLLAIKAVESFKVDYRLTYKDIKNLILELNNCINNININVNPYIILQIILLNYVDYNKEINKKDGNESVNKEDVNNSKESIKDQGPTKKNNSDKRTNDWVELRINNCFVNASKGYKEDVSKKWDNLKKNSKIQKIKGYVLDCSVVAASDEYAILACSIEHKDNEINDNITKIESVFNEKYNCKYKFIAITEEIWEKEKNKYINNIKKGNKYAYKNEEENTVKNRASIENLANELFENSKLEIEGE